MHIHLIAIGGSIMHNLAIALQRAGHHISGSDDEIYEPSRSLLQRNGLLPDKMGWDPARIDDKPDLVILGMHARKDNPELIAALEKDIPVESFPEFIGKQFREKRKVVIAGSHGKTTTCSMILHALASNRRDFDYMVGARIDGFDTMVSLSDASVAVLEGDEYLSSALDPRPKFLHYDPQVTVITGIAWDHMNVFPHFRQYLQQFQDLIGSMRDGSTLIYYENDDHLKQMAGEERGRLVLIPYRFLPYKIDDGNTEILLDGKKWTVPFFGSHNMQNCAAALEVCKILGLSEDNFINTMPSFKGAARRLETITTKGNALALRDFAHAPSKLQATIEAVRERFPGKRLIACYELHTYSSLNRDFLPQYAGTTGKADRAIIYFNPATVARKKLPPLEPDFIKSVFFPSQIELYDKKEELEQALQLEEGNNTVLLWMSSGHFDGLNIQEFSDKLLRP